VLAECGAEVVPLSPLADAALPARSQGVYLGGGFPELFAEQLTANTRIRATLQEHAQHGRPIYAECGGLMVLGQTLTTFEGQTWPMFGLLPVASRTQRQHLTIGYREVEALRLSVLMPAGGRVHGHEFHWSKADPPPSHLATYRLVGQDRLEGFSLGATLASYVHLNLAAHLSWPASSWPPVQPPPSESGISGTAPGESHRMTGPARCRRAAALRRRPGEVGGRGPRRLQPGADPTD
jgi:cobyrinic acid a,c-diamide synthase